MDYVSKQQHTLETKYAKHNRTEVLDAFKSDLLAPCLAYVEAWKQREINWFTPTGEMRKDLVEIVPEINRMDAEEVCWKILSTVLLDRNVTLQAIFGMFYNTIKVDMPYRKGRVLEVFIDAVEHSPFVELRMVGKYLNLCCTRKTLVDTANYSYVLPSLTYSPVLSNNNAGYESNQFHVITGGSLKQHDGDLCLDHINRMNAVCYSVDTRITRFTEPTFSDEPKWLSSKARYENPVEIEARRKQFNQWKDELPSRVNLLMRGSNRFFYKHRNDTRGRTYVKAWHLDFIGNKYARALVNPTIREHAEGVSDYI